jgi:hypothetical protein
MTDAPTTEPRHTVRKAATDQGWALRAHADGSYARTRRKGRKRSLPMRGGPRDNRDCGPGARSSGRELRPALGR